MSNVKKIYYFLDKMAPFEQQMDFDNAGFLVGRWNQEVSKILIALDITLPVIEEAARLGAQLILSHHPVIFHPAKSITDRDTVGRCLRALVSHDISAICLHTNLDVVQGGVNDALAKALGLSNTSILQSTGVYGPYGVKYGLGRLGTLEEAIAPMAFAELVKEALSAKAMRVVLGDRPIVRLAVAGGACGNLLKEAAEWDCDAFVTGDVKYDQFLEAAALGMTLIDAGHFPTENIVCPILQEWLTINLPDLEVVLSEVHSEVCFAL